MAGAVGAAAQLDVPAALEHPVEDGFGKIGIVQHAAPGRQRFVGGEDHRALVEVAVVDDLEEDIGRVGAVAEIADLVDHEHGDGYRSSECGGGGPGGRRARARR